MQEKEEVQGQGPEVKAQKEKLKVLIMDIKNVYEDGNVTKYLVKGTNCAFMNALRRIMMSNVPCLAVDTVNIYENDSVIFDEMLAHRLGMMPVKTDVKSYKKGDTVKLVLEKTGPGIVTAKDIKCTDPKIEILDKKIMIAKLDKEQKIRIEMTATMEAGKSHARHQPAIVSYNEVPEIDNSKAYANTKEILADFPEGIIEAKAGKLFLMDPYNTKIQNQYGDIMDKHGVKMAYSDTDFVLTIETTGQMTSKEVVEAALKELSAKAEELEKELKKL